MLELLAPAGNMDALIAAVQNGANAVYLGGQVLNARRGAGNFDAEALKRAVAYCHERDVRVHVTVNTIVMERELEQLCELAEQIAAAGADAAIVQDLGVARALQSMLPHLQLHASTQMAVHNRSGVIAAKELGFSRAVLAREMSFDEIKACGDVGIELEAFVHGALCVACSGQCLFSSMVGGRSGNRGMCAQPCRLPYRMEGAAEREGYLLSPKDLLGMDHIARLKEAGVCSLKIEGRLKRPEYVAVVTGAYRAAIDELENGKPKDDAKERREALRQIFNRGGFTGGYGPGLIDSELMYDRQPNHVGVAVGEARSRGAVRLDADIDVRDVLHLLSKSGEQKPVKLSGRGGETIRVALAAAGDVLMRLTSEKQMEAARQSFGEEHIRHDVKAEAEFHVGEKAKLRAVSGEFEACVEGDVVRKAEKQSASIERIRAQLEKTGGTIWSVSDLNVDADSDAFVPASMANALRRDALDELTRQKQDMMRVCDSSVRSMPAQPEREAVDNTRLIFAESTDVRTLISAGEAGADEMILDPLDLRTEALRAAAEGLKGRKWSLALPMVLPQAALDVLVRFVIEHEEDISAVYANNAAHLSVAWPVEVRGDFGLNIANEQAHETLREHGITVYTPSVELNAGQIRELTGKRALIVHGRIPLMQLRHCPYLAGQKGIRHADCHRCDSCAPEKRISASALIDRHGQRFPLQRVATDEGCIVRVLNADSLMLLRRADRLPAAWAYRVVIEPNENAGALMRLYRKALHGEDVREDAEFSQIQKDHTTTGHFFRGVE